jgi:hypothetical protein
MPRPQQHNVPDGRPAALRIREEEGPSRPARIGPGPPGATCASIIWTQRSTMRPIPRVEVGQ